MLWKIKALLRDAFAPSARSAIHISIEPTTQRRNVHSRHRHDAVPPRINGVHALIKPFATSHKRTPSLGPNQTGNDQTQEAKHALPLRKVKASDCCHANDNASHGRKDKTSAPRY